MNGIMANREAKRLFGDSAMAWRKQGGIHVVGKVSSNGRLSVCGEGNSWEEAFETASRLIKK